jgi:glycosyltransferase involved in cell wall biosynthesis
VRIAVNTRFLLKDKLEGIGTFTHETLRRMVHSHPEQEFIFIFDRPFDEEYIYGSNVTPVVAYPQARHPFLYIPYFQYTIPYLLAKYRADVFLSPDGYLTLRSVIPQVQVIHDLSFEHYPNDISKAGSWYYRHYFPKFARKAARIATVSQFSKEDIITRYNIAPEKVDVVYNGASENFVPAREELKQFVRRKFVHDHAYFIYVGAIQPRKNIVNLLKAFDAFRERHPSGIKLVMVGRKAWKTSAVEEAYEQMRFKEDVVFTGRVSNEELCALLSGALALTYVSYFEGFGIPILEAMCCDTPVICSGITSMPEVGGDAALYVDPFSVDSICEAMLKVARDPQYREQMIAAGRLQRTRFSWDKTSLALWNVLESIIRQ